jgi:hypothetical protein
MKINRALLWDYDFSEDALRSSSFTSWYLSRVLSHGSSQDIRDAGGVEEVRRCFGKLHLPLEVERLWSWYLNIPGPRAELYGYLHTFPTHLP